MVTHLSSSAQPRNPRSAQLFIHMQKFVSNIRISKSTLRRSSHKKSRLGCVNCKKRRIKCDEVKPVCSNCAASRNFTKCEYLVDAVPTKNRRNRRTRTHVTTSSTFASVFSGAPLESEFASDHIKTEQVTDSNLGSKPPIPIHVSASSPLVTSPSSIISTHFHDAYSQYLHHHFVAITWSTVGDLVDARIGGSSLPISSPLLTTIYPFMEHAQLGISALHILHLHFLGNISSNCLRSAHQHCQQDIVITCNPSEIRRLERAALYHTVEALRCFREFYSSGPLGLFSGDAKTETDMRVALMCSLTFCILCLFDNFPSSYMFSSLPLTAISPLTSQDQLYSMARSWLVRWFLLYSGTRTLGLKLVSKVSYDTHSQRGVGPLPLPFHLRHITAWGILPKQLIPLLSHLMNRELSEGGITIDTKMKEALQMFPLHAAVTKEISRMGISDIDTILNALYVLSNVCLMIRSGRFTTEEILIYFISCPLFVHERFMYLVVEKNPIALVTLVHLSALLGVLFSGGQGRNCRFHRWWLSGCRPEKLKEETEELLGYLGEDWQELVTWVVEFQKMVWQNKDPFQSIRESDQPEHERLGFQLDQLPRVMGATCIKVQKLYTPPEKGRNRMERNLHRFYESTIKQRTGYQAATGFGRLLGNVTQKCVELK